MTTDKLQKIIAEKNEQLEREAVCSASEIIDRIAALQQVKLDADKEIAERQKQLKELTVLQLNAVALLGE